MILCGALVFAQLEFGFLPILCTHFPVEHGPRQSNIASFPHRVSAAPLTCHLLRRSCALTRSEHSQKKSWFSDQFNPKSRLSTPVSPPNTRRMHAFSSPSSCCCCGSAGHDDWRFHAQRAGFCCASRVAHPTMISREGQMTWTELIET